MENLFKQAKRESAVDIVVNSIKELLLQRKLKPGDRIPSEVEISEGLGVSRGSVREAIKILSAFGIIDVRVGNGSFVGSDFKNDAMSLLLFNFLISNPDLSNLYEFRYLFEINILQLIEKHYDKNEEERKNLILNLEALKKLIDTSADQELISENDLEFHRILGKASNNILMENIYYIIIDFMEKSIKSTHSKQKGEIVYNIHKQIVNLIENKEFDKIETVIELSVNTWSTLQELE